MPDAAATSTALGAHRRLTPKGEATRARIVDQAIELFVEQGYASASVRDLASRSGVSSGAIYGSFRGKADLLAAAVDAIIESDVESLPAGVTQQALPDIDAYQYEHLSQRDRLRTLLLEAAVAARAEPNVRDRLRDAMAPHLDMATEAHAEWQERAGVDAQLDMRTLVLLLWSADLGLAVLDAMGIERPEPKVWAGLVRRMLTALAAPDARPGAPTPRSALRSAPRSGRR
jgi:AcrR family transcriptional regulator